MAKKNTPKNVSFKLSRGILVRGKAFYPAKDKNKKTILSLPLTLARELENSSKGMIVDENPNTELPSDNTDDLDDVFGKDD